MTYTIEQLAEASGVSQRSIYAYAQRQLIPLPLKEGRRFVYTEEHLEALQLVRVFLRLGLPMRQLEQLMVGREQAAVRRALAPVLPLARLIDETEHRLDGLQRKARVPKTEELDLSDLGLEDPLWLRRELAEAERLRDRLQTEFHQAGAAVLRELVGADARQSEQQNTTIVSGADRSREISIETLASEIRGQLRLLQETLDDTKLGALREGFLTGLITARSAGWCPGATIDPPVGLPPSLVATFRAFVAGELATGE